MVSHRYSFILRILSVLFVLALAVIVGYYAGFNKEENTTSPEGSAVLGASTTVGEQVSYDESLAMVNYIDDAEFSPKKEEKSNVESPLSLTAQLGGLLGLGKEKLSSALPSDITVALNVNDRQNEDGMLVVSATVTSSGKPDYIPFRLRVDYDDGGKEVRAGKLTPDHPAISFQLRHKYEKPRMYLVSAYVEAVGDIVAENNKDSVAVSVAQIGNYITGEEVETATATPIPTQYNLTEIIIPKIQELFIYRGYNEWKATDKYSQVRYSVWPDEKHFVVHTTYGSDNSKNATWCPRVDDVYSWEGGQLMQVDNVDHFTGLISRFSGDKLVVPEFMNPGDSKDSTFTAANYEFSRGDSECQIGKLSKAKNISYRSKVNFMEDSDWAPITGNGERLKGVRIIETFSPIGYRNDTRTEEYFYYKHPTLGYLLLHARILAGDSSAGNVQVVSDYRLSSIVKN
ncbi:MAG: hypothetical protein CEN90_183 [Parcubacteria group bacterium Licking1014_17]|nr:MAG: hypothetical protein CEN90_183 [Parcubacteria group bacterium Licking1014_17]